MNQPITKIVLFSEVNSKFGLPFLNELISRAEFSVEALITSPEGQFCSYYKDEPDPVNLAEEANKRGIPVFRPRNVNDPELIQAMKNIEADFFLIANYQQILKKPLISTPKEMTINFHPSPLPRYAGLAPFFWMAKNGETKGGVSCIKVTPEVDGGLLIAQKQLPMNGNETAIEIRDLHFKESVSLLKDVMDMMIRRNIQTKLQDQSKRSYYSGPKEKDYLINWENDVETILRTIRASFPRPGAFFINESNQKIRIIEAEKTNCNRPLSHAGMFSVDKNRLIVAANDGWLHIKAFAINDEILTNFQDFFLLRPTLKKLEGVL